MCAVCRVAYNNGLDVLQSILGYNEQAVPWGWTNYIYPNFGGVISGLLSQTYEGGIVYFEVRPLLALCCHMPALNDSFLQR